MAEFGKEPNCRSSPAGQERAERHWLPTSLRRPFLATLAAVFILMSIGIETLRQYSNRNHGLIHLKSYEQLAPLTSGVYTYVPTAFAILAVALWNICALDVLRLEPYFQLAKPEGVPGDVLFTNYGFFYGIMAPVMALRNRHWIVVCVSTTSIILRMSLPSVLSGLVSLDEPSLVFTRHLNTWPSLVNLETQNTLFANAASHLANNNLTHVDTFFSYKVPDYSIPPVSLPAHSRPGTSHWGLNHDIYWSDISCMESRSAKVIPRAVHDSRYPTTLLEWNIRNLTIQSSSHTNITSNCEVDISLNSTYPQKNDRLPQIIYWEPLGSHGNSSATFTWNGEGCQSLSLFGLSIDVNSISKNLTSNATVFGCKSTYLRSTADITLPTNTSIATATNISTPATTLNSKDFGITEFQHMLFAKLSHGGRSLWKDRNTPLTFPDSSSNRSIARLQPSRTSLTQYKKDIGQRWNQIFVSTLNRLFNTTADPIRVQAERSTFTIVYRVTSHTATIAEALLLSASLLLLVMCFLYPRRPSFLFSDPGPIAAQCALITDMFSSLSHITNADLDFCRATPRQLRQFSRSLWCRLIDGPDGKRIKITPRQGRSKPIKPRSPRTLRLTMRPHFLTPLWFLIECLLMIGVLAAFGISFQFMRLDKFDTLDSVGMVILWLFLDYGPTVIASMISSLFVSVHRHIGSMEPWVQLRGGMALSKDSLAVNFGAHTPLTIWSQFRDKKPLLLIVLSIVCIFDFGLTIASSGMFEPTVETWTDPTNAITTQYNTSAFDNPQVRTDFSGINLIYDVLRIGSPLLSWNTANFSFFPLGIDDPGAEWLDRSIYTARTRGVGVELQCGEASYSHNASGSSYWTYNPSLNARESNCIAELPEPIPIPPKVSSNSYNGSLYYGSTLNETGACRASFAVGHVNTNDTGSSIGGGFSNVFSCSPKIIIEDFQLDFDLDGVVSYDQPIRGSSITSGQMFQNASESLSSFNDAFMRYTHLENSWNVLLISQIYNNLDSNHSSHGTSWRHSHSNRPHHKSHNHTQHIATTESQKRDLLKRTLQLAYQTAFSSYITLQRDLYMSPATFPENANATVPAVVTSTSWGITPSNITIVVIIVLLSIDIAVLMAVFLLRHGHYSGAPFPRSIGSLMPWAYQSRMLNDVRDTNTWSGEKRNEHLQELGHLYRFGNFGGSDVHVALDYDEKPFIEGDYELDRIDLPGRASGQEVGGAHLADGGVLRHSAHSSETGTGT